MATAAEVHLRPELWQGAEENQDLSNVLETDGLDWGDADANQFVQKAIESTFHAGNMRRSILPPPQPAPQWNELPFGVQWLTFKTIMEEQRSFTVTAVCILRLSHQQIWTFVEKYIAEWTSIHESRKKPGAAWAQQILTFTAQHPNQMMRKQILPTRPRHAIDRLTSDDLRSGEAYLKRLGLLKTAALVRDWQNTIELNSLKLKIDNHIVQRVRDLRLVNFAIAKGWVSREQVDNQLVADCSTGAMSSSKWHENEPIDEMFTKFTRSDVRSHTEQQVGATISPPASVTAAVPAGENQSLESPSHLPRQLPNFQRPTDRVSTELSAAFRRISQGVPYEHVSGWLVRTCVEAGEALTPCKPTSATAVPQERASQQAPAAEQGQQAKSAGSTRTGTLDVVATSAGVGVSQEQQTRNDPGHASQNTARAESEKENNTTDLTGQMPSPGIETDGSGSQHRRAATPSKDREAPPRFAPRRQHSEAQQLALPAAAPEPTPSETLRKLLQTRWAKYLDPEEDQPPEIQVAKPKKKKAERDLPFEDDLDIGKIPEDDDDDDYIPGVNTHPKHAVPKGPKGVTTTTVQHSPSPRKGSVGPRITLKRKEAPGTPSPAGARFTSGAHCHVDAKRRAQSHRASEHSEAVGCPPNKRRRLEQGGNSNAVANTVHESLPRQSDTLFGGVLRHEVLPSLEGNAQKARFAWSADHAHYAGVATLAKQSYHADRLSMCPAAVQYRSSLWESGRLENQETMRSSKAMRELGRLKALKGELEIAEEANKGIRTGPAENAKLAGCADTATYAWQATEAYLAVVVGENQVHPET